MRHQGSYTHFYEKLSKGIIMNIDKTLVCYMSGTGTTKKYAEAFAKTLPGTVQICELNARTPIDAQLTEHDLLVVAAPVFGGHIPPFVFEQLKNINGSNTPAVALAVYGARDYDSALLEMQAKLASKGFELVGAAALVARHSIVQSIAPDRPNAGDIKEAEEFARKISARLEGMTCIQDRPDFDFKGELVEAEPSSNTPIVSKDCISCGACAAQCPALAIPKDAPNTTDSDACISCLRCIEVCPTGARMLPAPVIEYVSNLLAKLADPAKENEFF